MVSLYETASLFSMGQCRAVRYLWTPLPIYNLPYSKALQNIANLCNTSCIQLYWAPAMVKLIPAQSVTGDLLDIHCIIIDCTRLTETQQNAFIWLMYIPSLKLHCDVNNVLFLPYSNLIDSQAFWVLQRAIVVNAVTIGFHIGWGLRKVQCPFSDIKPRIVYWLRVG